MDTLRLRLRGRRAAGRVGNRNLRPFLEQLEDRSLLSGLELPLASMAEPGASTNGASSSVFAYLEGEIATPRDKDAFPIHVDTTDFTIHSWGVFLGFELHSAGGSRLNPGRVQIKPQGKSVAVPWYSIDGSGPQSSSPAHRSSMTIATVRPGSFQLIVSGDRHTTGAYQVDVFLVGDANGDQRVDKGDVQLIHSLRGKRFGKAGYQRDADVNRDGIINPADEGFARPVADVPGSHAKLHKPPPLRRGCLSRRRPFAGEF